MYASTGFVRLGHSFPLQKRLNPNASPVFINNYCFRGSSRRSLARNYVAPLEIDYLHAGIYGIHVFERREGTTQQCPLGATSCVALLEGSGRKLHQKLLLSTLFAQRSPDLVRTLLVGVMNLSCRRGVDSFSFSRPKFRGMSPFIPSFYLRHTRYQLLLTYYCSEVL